MKRLLVGVSLIVGMLGLLIWFSRHSIANALIDDGLRIATDRAGRIGIKMVNTQTDPVRIPTPWEVRIPNFRTEFDLGDSNKNQLRSEFRARTARATLAGVFPPKYRLHLDEFSLRFHPEDVPANFPFEAFEDAGFHSSPLPATDPKAAMGIAIDRLRLLFEENAVEADFSLSGTVELQLGPHGEAKAMMYTEKLADGRVRLRFSKGDIRRVADQAKIEIADDELEIVALYPVRTPVLLLISTKAKRDAAARKKAEPGFPDDAYRHVTWSYHLTRTFGEEFAKEVTDAHETLPNNTPEERAMDYHNNAVARELAKREIPAAELEKIIRSDPRIIRRPEDVAGMGELLR